jgi:hypothetical protein
VNEGLILRCMFVNPRDDVSCQVDVHILQAHAGSNDGVIALHNSFRVHKVRYIYSIQFTR